MNALELDCIDRSREPIEVQLTTSILNGIGDKKVWQLRSLMAKLQSELEGSATAAEMAREALTEGRNERRILPLFKSNVLQQLLIESIGSRITQIGHLSDPKTKHLMASFDLDA